MSIFVNEKIKKIMLILQTDFLSVWNCYPSMSFQAFAT